MCDLPPLPADETLQLIRLAQGGSAEAVNELAVRNMGLVRSVALRFTGRGADREDLVQIGSVGFMKAVRRFDTSFGTAFSTYAVPLIAGEIRRFLRDDGMVKVSRKYKELAARIARLTDEALLQGRPALKIREIAEALGEDPLDITAAMEAAQPCVSLNEPVFEEGSNTELADTLQCSAAADDPAIDKAYVAELLEKLEPDERILMRLRYFNDLTQAETARRLGVSQTRVSRAEAKILMKLRRIAEEE